MLYQILGK